MKKLALTLTIAASALALNACESTGRGDIDTEPPYAMERTASHSQTPTYRVETTETVSTPVRAERTFKRMQTK